MGEISPNDGDDVVAVVGLLPNRVLDSADNGSFSPFAVTGATILDVSAFSDRAHGVALQTLSEDAGAQRIVVVGEADDDALVARFMPDGQLDDGNDSVTGDGFGNSDGVVLHDIPGGEANFFDVAVNASNQIYVVGDGTTFSFITALQETPPEFGTYAIIGSYDSNGTNANVLYEPASDSGFATFRSVSISSGGSIVAAGSDEGDFLVAR